MFVGNQDRSKQIYIEDTEVNPSLLVEQTKA